jgi:hypothetical protein
VGNFVAVTSDDEAYIGGAILSPCWRIGDFDDGSGYGTEVSYISISRNTESETEVLNYSGIRILDRGRV